MDTQLFSMAITQLGISLILAVGVAWSTFKLFRYFIRRHYPVGVDNVSFSILAGAVLYSVAHILSGVLQPMLTLIRTLRLNEKSNAAFLGEALGYGLLFIGLGGLIAYIVIVSGLYLFTLMTRSVNEFEEISKDNRAVGILTGVIIIVIAIFVKDSAVLLIESLIPYPDFPLRT